MAAPVVTLSGKYTFRKSMSYLLTCFSEEFLDSLAEEEWDIILKKLPYDAIDMAIRADDPDQSLRNLIDNYKIIYGLAPQAPVEVVESGLAETTLTTDSTELGSTHIYVFQAPLLLKCYSRV